MSLPLESLSLKLRKLFGDVGAEVFCLHGTMLNLRLSSAHVGVVPEVKNPDTWVMSPPVESRARSSYELKLTLTRSPSDF